MSGVTPPPGNDSLFDRRARCGQCVLHAVLLLLELHLGRRADADDRDAAGELGEALLELLAIVVAGGRVDLAADLLDTTLDGVNGAATLDDRGVVLGRDELTTAAEVFRS